MADQPGPNSGPNSFGDLVKWAITPPQSYVVYVIGLLLVYGVCYYAGTLNPKKAATPPPQTITAPRD
jgi:hypothetical protein